MRRAFRGLAAVMAITALLACRRGPEEGAHCRVADRRACVGTDRALVCEWGVWRRVPCRGPRGCARIDGEDDCDDTAAVREDACPSNPPVDYACSPDGSEALVCRNGAFTLWRRCRGRNGCRVDAGRVVCDTTRGEDGDPCETPGEHACSDDGGAMLVCDGHALAVASFCRGSAGCRVHADGPRIDCADDVAVEGDPCDEPRRIACAADGKSELSCEAGRYVKRRACTRRDCRVEATEVDCD